MQQHCITESLSLLTNWARRPDAANDLREIFGASKHQSAGLLEQIGQGDFSWIPKIRSLPAIEGVIGAASDTILGAYSRETGTIYLASDCPSEQVTPVLLEEIGHHIDSLFNATETTGDEGALFSATVRGITLSDEEITAILNEDDADSINIDGHLINIECARRPAPRRAPATPIVTVKPKPIPPPDTISSAVSYDLSVRAPNSHGLILTGSGNLVGKGNSQSYNVLQSNSGSTTLIGGTGNNSLIGGTTGLDSLIGNSLSDTFVINNANTKISENPNGGIDLVQTTLAAYTLAANIENLTGTGTGPQSLTGNTLTNSITASNFRSTLVGGGGNDTLMGGTGNDSLVGGTGNDSLLGSAGDDIIYGGGGNDYISGGDGNDTLVSQLFGSTTLEGGSGNDVLVDSGVISTLLGGTGNDTYIVSNAGSTLIEDLYTGGTNLVQTTLSAYTLGNNLQNLTAIGANKVTLTGNTLANVLTANNAGNRLIGGDNGRIDSLVGGLGNDTFVVSSAGSTVTEASTTGGIDLVETTLSSYTLGANLEQLTYTGGAVSATLTGNDLANSITGGTGADSIIGVANAGYIAANRATWDTINGGGGTDTVEAVQQFVLGSNINTILFNGTGLLDLNQMSGAENPYTVGAITALNNTAAVTLMGNTLGGYSTGINLEANTSANTRLIGGNGNDTLTAKGASQALIGGSGNDSLTAFFAGGTTLVGGKAGDSLSGNDTLTASDPSINGTANTFVLGDSTTDYYQGPNKATIINFGFQNNPNYLSRADNIVLNGVRSDYKTATSGIGNLNVDLIYTAGAGNDTLATFINASNNDVLNLLGSTRTTYVV
jgi:Ca2+-binding RTX toxin-like protein